MRALAQVVSMLLAAHGGDRAATSRPPAPRHVEIVGLDYAFQMPAALNAGPTTFQFVNRGKVRHELNISLLKPGATVEQFMKAVQADQPTAAFRDAPVGVLFAAPGKRATARLSTELLPGRTYVVICINRDDPKAKRHLAMGMYSAFTPRESREAPTPAGRVDTITATDYAFRYPATVPAGHHAFALVNAGKVRHEFVMLLLKNGVTLQQALATEKAGGDVDAQIEDAIGVLHSPAGTTPLGRLELEMLPGRTYAIICTFSDNDKSPPHLALGMVGAIDVQAKGAP